jgi:hypothetical protein
LYAGVVPGPWLRKNNTKNEVIKENIRTHCKRSKRIIEKLTEQRRRIMVIKYHIPWKQDVRTERNSCRTSWAERSVEGPTCR